MQFDIEDEQRLIMELEAISKQSGYSLPSSKISSAAPPQVNRASLICMLTISYYYIYYTLFLPRGKVLLHYMWMRISVLAQA